MDETVRKQMRLLDQCDNELEELYHNYAKSFGLSDTALWLLYIIYDMGETCTQSDICRIWFYKRQSINSALKKLENMGYLALSSIPGNQKSKNIILTSLGKTVVDKAIIPLVDAEGEMWMSFSETERNSFIYLAKKRNYLFRIQLNETMKKRCRTEKTQ